MATQLFLEPTSNSSTTFNVLVDILDASSIQVNSYARLAFTTTDLFSNGHLTDLHKVDYDIRNNDREHESITRTPSTPFP